MFVTHLMEAIAKLRTLLQRQIPQRAHDRVSSKDTDKNTPSK